MKKLKLFGMFALTFALVFGVVSCSSGSSNDDLEEVLKEDDVDLSGTWEVTDIDMAYDIDIDGEGITSDAKKLAKEEFEKSMLKGKTIDDLTLDEKIAMVGCPKTVTLSTKEEAKAFFDNMVKQAKETNDKYKNGPVEERAFGVSAKVTEEMSVEMNKDRTKFIYGTAFTYEMDYTVYKITMDSDAEVTYTKK